MAPGGAGWARGSRCSPRCLRWSRALVLPDLERLHEPLGRGARASPALPGGGGPAEAGEEAACEEQREVERCWGGRAAPFPPLHALWEGSSSPRATSCSLQCSRGCREGSGPTDPVVDRGELMGGWRWLRWPAGSWGVSGTSAGPRTPSEPLLSSLRGRRAPCLHAQGVLPAHQPPPALHPEAGQDPHGEPGAGGLGQGLGTRPGAVPEPTDWR